MHTAEFIQSKANYIQRKQKELESQEQKHRSEIIKFQNEILDLQNEVSVCQNEICKLKDNTHNEVNNLNGTVCIKPNDISFFKGTSQLVRKQKKHCKGLLMQALLAETWNTKMTDDQHKVCTISFERPVNYLCDAWHVFPPKYEAWTHFNRP